MSWLYWVRRFGRLSETINGDPASNPLAGPGLALTYRNVMGTSCLPAGLGYLIAGCPIAITA